MKSKPNLKVWFQGQCTKSSKGAHVYDDYQEMFYCLFNTVLKKM